MVFLTILELSVRLSFYTVYRVSETIGSYSYGLLFGWKPSQEELTKELLAEIRELRKETRLLKDQLPLEAEYEIIKDESSEIKDESSEIKDESSEIKDEST